jgi:DNA-binding NarL/FixJ family response regulator
LTLAHTLAEYSGLLKDAGLRFSKSIPIRSPILVIGYRQEPRGRFQKLTKNYSGISIQDSTIDVIRTDTVSPTTSMNTKIRILIADDHPAVREGLVRILTRQKDMSVIGKARDGEEACQLYDKLSPDILLLDLRMPKKDGLEVIKDLMSRVPKPRIIVVTAYQATEDIRLALAAGAKGYLFKDAEPPQLRDTVRRVFAGESVLPPGVAGQLAASLGEPALSRREMEVLRRLCAGDSNKEIAQKVYLSESSVKLYIKNVYKKLGAAGRTAAVAIAARRGLVRFI